MTSRGDLVTGQIVHDLVVRGTNRAALSVCSIADRMWYMCIEKSQYHKSRASSETYY